MKELRVSFAMGGGVSLGTFCGAALSESLKLLVVENEKTRKYDKIVIDVFSGASAGAMSLGIMLRTLIHREANKEQESIRKLKEEFRNFQNFRPETQKDLIAVQVLQSIQEEIWLNEINLEQLMGNSLENKKDNHAGLFNRNVITNIAKKYIEFIPNYKEDKRLLGNQILYACTLTNMTPIILNKSDIVTNNPTLQHREVRVFDIHFGITNANDLTESSRWYRYHTADKVPGKISDLRNNKAWSTIAATAVASGCFPIAFEPVVLNRKKFEFEANVWKNLNLDTKEEHPFTYVDGGTFNNEPLYEAIRLSSFIDSQKPESEFERCIIFVDPKLTPLPTSFILPLHKRNTLGENNHVLSLTNTQRIGKTVLSLLSAILTESSITESNKIYNNQKYIEYRNQARDFFIEMLTKTPTVALLKAKKEFCEKILNEKYMLSLFPAGSLMLKQELLRIIIEEKNNLPQLGELQGITLAERDVIIQHICDSNFDSIPVSFHEECLKILVCIATDLVMDLPGKKKKEYFVSIVPLIKLPSGQEEIKELPGGKLAGFAGFMSKYAGHYEINLAKYFTKKALNEKGLISFQANSPLPIFTQEQAFNKEVDLQIGKLSDHLGQMLSTLLPNGLQTLGQSFISSFIAQTLRDFFQKKETLSFEFQILLPNKNYLLEEDGLGNDDEPIKLELDQYCLITFAEYDLKLNSWREKGHVRKINDFLGIQINEDGFMARNPLFCTIKMPTEDSVKKMKLFTNPVFRLNLDAVNHKAKTLSSSEWKECNDIKLLDDIIFS